MRARAETVVCIAGNETLARLVIARLDAAGIPARIEGDLLCDPVVASERLYSLSGTRVLVPTFALARAQEVLGALDHAPEDDAANHPSAPAPDAPAPAPARPRAAPADRSMKPLVLALYGWALYQFLQRFLP